MKDKKQKQNPYATVAGGKITAPHAPAADPKATRRTGTDLRAKKR